MYIFKPSHIFFITFICKITTIFKRNTFLETDIDDLGNQLPKLYFLHCVIKI